MDLHYLADHNPLVYKKLLEEGYDLEVLIDMCKDLFEILDIINYENNKLVGEFVGRAKVVYNSLNNITADPIYQLDPDSRMTASRITI